MENNNRSMDLPDALRIFGAGFMWIAFIYALKTDSTLDLMICAVGFFGGIFMLVASKKIRLSIEQLETARESASQRQ